jgi:hypothetical protein
MEVEMEVKYWPIYRFYNTRQASLLVPYYLVVLPLVNWLTGLNIITAVNRDFFM